MPKQATERAIDTPFSKRSSGSGTIVSASGTATSIPVHGLESIYHTGNLDSRYYTESELNAGQLNSLYYTETELNAGQLDTRYYTETESDAKYALLTTSITGTGALGGGGTLAANRTVTLNTPGGLSATSTNSSATNHTHSIDSTIARSAIDIGVSGLGLSGGGNLTANRTITLASSSNPGAAASILASTSSGGLTLATLTTTGAISGATNTNTAHTLGYATTGYVGFSGFAGFAANGFANTTGYALAQYNTDGTLYINSPTTVNIRNSGSQLAAFGSTGLVVESGKLVGSNGYVSGWAGSGWRADQNVSVSGQSFAEFDNLSIRGTLSVYELVINQIRATNGTLIVSSAGKIDSVSGSDWTFEDPNASSLCAFAVNDLVIIQSVDVNASTIVKRIVRRVSAVSGKTITVTAATGGPADTGTAVAGDTVVRFGNTSNAARQGVVLITSDMSNSPYQDVISGVTSWADWTGGTKTRVRMGHLSGITGTANEYGLIAGNGFTTADSWVKFSTSAVQQNNISSSWYNAGANTVLIQSDGDIFAGSNLGSTATTALVVLSNAQTYAGESLGAGDLIIGNKAAGHMLWDASAGTLNFRDNTTTQAYVNTSGEIVAGSGNVVMNSYALTVGGNVTMDGSGITLPVQSYSTEPSISGLLISYTDPKRIHQGNLELASYTVDFDPLLGKRTGATILHAAPSVSDFLSGGFAYEGSYSRLLIKSLGYYGASERSSYIDMWAGNDNNIDRGFINIVAKDYVYMPQKLIVGNDTEVIKVTGSGTSGNASVGYIAFYDSNTSTRRGFIGDAVTSNTDIYVKADTGALHLGDTTSTDVIVLSSGGTKILGNIGFYNATPVTRSAAYTQTYATADRTIASRTAAALTNNTGGTVSTTLAAITAGASYTQADMTAVKNALASLADQVNKLRDDGLDTTQGVNSIIDDLQTNGLFQ